MLLILVNSIIIETYSIIDGRMPEYLRQPPRIKVLEAIGAIADGRVKLIDDNTAEVISSQGDRKYTVSVDVPRRIACSSDNGTVYRGYVGYPIISVLMIKGELPYDQKLADSLKGINWRMLNEKYKKYKLVEDHIKAILRFKGIPGNKVDEFIKDVLTKLKAMKLIKSNECLVD